MRSCCIDHNPPSSLETDGGGHGGWENCGKIPAQRVVEAVANCPRGKDSIRGEKNTIKIGEDDRT